jgi:hypothetical protein
MSFDPPTQIVNTNRQSGNGAQAGFESECTSEFLDFDIVTCILKDEIVEFYAQKSLSQYSCQALRN